MGFTVKDILQLEVAPALGCTEPVAIALGSAACRVLADGRAPEKLEVWVSANIYKNGLAVSIPGTRGLAGIDLSAALGAFGGDPMQKLEVLDGISEPMVDQAVQFTRGGHVTIHIQEDKSGVYIRTLLTARGDTFESIIESLHDNITSLAVNGKPVHTHDLLGNTRDQAGRGDQLARLEAWLKDLSLVSLLELVDSFDQEDLDFIETGVRYNMRLSDYGLRHGAGLGIGKALQRLKRQKLLTDDMVLSARILTSAAADARMSGVKLPAMSSAGSGNHGLTAILPIWAVRDFVDVEPHAVLRAVGFSHIITAYIKAFTGRLSAVCGCSVAAGAGATAGITYLLGGDVNHISGAIKNLTTDLAGVICDGAKAGCALKLMTAAGTAVQAALFSLQGVVVGGTDGIICDSPEKTMQNIGILSTQGMIETDRTILQIMLDKQFS